MNALSKALAAPLVVSWEADGKTITTTWSASRDMWAMEVATSTGGSTHWWCTPQEMTAWVIGRRYMRQWSDAHYLATAKRLAAIRRAEAEHAAEWVYDDAAGSYVRRCDLADSRSC